MYAELGAIVCHCESHAGVSMPRFSYLFHSAMSRPIVVEISFHDFDGVML